MRPSLLILLACFVLPVSAQDLIDDAAAREAVVEDANIAEARTQEASTQQNSVPEAISEELPVEEAEAQQAEVQEAEAEQTPSQAPAQTTTVLKKSETVNLSATIVGNQEQPTVLYIVPWKAAEDTTILYLPLNSKALEELFGHVERVEHQRQVQFLEQLDD